MNVNNSANLKRRPSYTMMVGRMIRKLSTVQEQEEEEEDEEEGEEDEEVVENGGDLRNSIHQRRLLELLVGQEVEMRHFEVKKLRQGNNRSSYNAITLKFSLNTCSKILLACSLQKIRL